MTSLLALVTGVVLFSAGRMLMTPASEAASGGGPGDDSAAANTALVRRFYAEVWNGGRLASVAEFVAVDHRYHDPSVPEVAAGPAGVTQVVAAHRRAFPDAAIALDDVVAQGDRVAVRFTARGTHRGKVLSAEATGLPVTVGGVAVHRIAHRQIAETWLTWDTYGLAEQVGLFLLPAPTDGSWDGAPTRERRDRPY